MNGIEKTGVCRGTIDPGDTIPTGSTGVTALEAIGAIDRIAVIAHIVNKAGVFIGVRVPGVGTGRLDIKI